MIIGVTLLGSKINRHEKPIPVPVLYAACGG